MRFCTVINCMDGRIQLPVIRYLQKRFDVDYVDTITEAGPNLILSEATNPAAVQSILERLEISIDNHHPTGIAIAGHHDCGGNPASEQEQIQHIQKAITFLHQHIKNIDIIGLWIDKNQDVHEVDEN